MLPLFFHEVTKETFVLHYATAADVKRARSESTKVRNQAQRKRVEVKFAPIKRKPREAAWAEYRATGTKYKQPTLH
jgi:hypothetical protein